jgi:hypothetical protein
MYAITDANTRLVNNRYFQLDIPLHKAKNQAVE